jgi:putative membrane protein
VVAVVISFALQSALRELPVGDDRWPLAFYLWTWASSVLALAVFLDLAAAAAWGAVAMGLVAVPLARSVRR